jgi:hypothetical protein
MKCDEDHSQWAMGSHTVCITHSIVNLYIISFYVNEPEGKKMTFSKQGMLISHAITLTVILLILVAWKTPSSQVLPFNLEGKTSAQNPNNGSAVFAI